MDWSHLLQAALTLVVSFAVKWFFAQIGVSMDDASFAAFVGAIVTWLLGLFIHTNVKNGLMKTGLRGLYGKEAK